VSRGWFRKSKCPHQPLDTKKKFKTPHKPLDTSNSIDQDDNKFKETKKSQHGAIKKHAKTSGFSLVFNMFTCFVLFAKNVFLTAQGLQQHFVKIIKNHKMQNEYHRRRTIDFVKILNATAVLQYVPIFMS